MKLERRAAVVGALFLLVPFPVSIAGEVPSIRAEAKSVVATLASPEYWGRGYTKGGMGKAADYLVRKIRSIGLVPLSGSSFRQPFEFPVNTFPGKMELRLNGRRLVPGVDFIVSPGTPGGTAKGTLVRKDDSTYVDPAGKLTVSLQDKLTWSVARKQLPENFVLVDRARFPETPVSFSYDIEAKFVPSFHADNLAAVVRGTVNPDRYFFFTAHYDHLGGMGADTYFPGANDNASGVSLLLALAKYYSAHPQPYSIGFLFFAGEEAGLIGSKYFVEHPTIDLSRIRFLLNFDLEGTGEEGATVVNATEFPDEFSILTSINSVGHYLVQIGARGKAANSDHYWFTEHGVPAFFMYTMGGIKAYHDVYDRSETLPMTKIDDVFALTLKFGEKISEEGLVSP